MWSSGRKWLGGAVLVGVMSLAPVAMAVDLVVAAASWSGNVAVENVPVAGASCAATLENLKSAGFKIVDVQAGAGLTYTTEREAKRNRPAAYVIIVCGAALEEEEESLPGPTDAG